LLDDFTRENGATRYVPGSHRWGKLPQDVLADPSAPHSDEKLIIGRAGTVVVINVHLWLRRGFVLFAISLPGHQAHLLFAEIGQMFEPGAVFEIDLVIFGGKIRRTPPG
jgi:hypothetical protein